MSLAVLSSRALIGMEAPEVSVEVHLANGLPALTIVGLPDTEVRESKDRVRAALLNAGFDFPNRRITVNLAPADLPKESGRFDLPIALGILAASGQIPGKQFSHYEFAGELSLSGQLRPIRGALAMTFAMHRREGGSQRAFILPAANADEAALVADACIFPAVSLLQVCAHFCSKDGTLLLTRHVPKPQALPLACADFADVKGQQHAKRALEVAAAGGHSMLLVGPPGSGKTMLASRLTSILPAMTDDEALESAAVQSLCNSFSARQWKVRPYRAPHHSASGAALVGGGSNPRPGEVSLAHSGVLFLDELLEFDRSVLEALREPLESGRITISRAARHADFPARFQLIAAMNPCPCGYRGAGSDRCHCSPDMVLRYQQRLSGPLLDRIDMQIEVGALTHEALHTRVHGEPSALIAARVERAFQIQLARGDGINARLGPAGIERHCTPDARGEQLLRAAMERLHWSARSYHRVLKVARTIADLAGAARIAPAHVAEAIQYRRVLHER